MSLSSASSSSLAPTAAPSSSTIVSISVASRIIAESEFVIAVVVADDVATTGLELLTMRLVVALANDAAVVVDAVDVLDLRSCCEWSRISFASDWGTVEDVVGVFGPTTEVVSTTVTIFEQEDLALPGLMRLPALFSSICLLAAIVRRKQLFGEV